MRLFLWLPALLLASCNPKNQVAFKDDCQNLSEKFIQFSSERQADSAMYYLDKTIDCDSESDFFKFEKVKYYVSLEQYENAYNYLDVLLSKNEPSYLTYKGALGLKLEKPEAEGFLRKAHEAYSDMSLNKINRLNAVLYKIGLDNYFIGKEYAEKQIVKYRRKARKEEYKLQTIDFLENTMNSSNRKDVLLIIFNIR